MKTRVVAGVLLICSCGLRAYAAGNDSTIGDLKRMGVEDLLNIEVTSVARRPEKLLGAAAAIQIVTAEEIRRSGAASLPEVLRLADNLQVARRGAHGWAVSARGFNTELGNKLLVMIDGRSVYTPHFSGVYWDAQDYLLEDIERIEIVSGPGGTLWGANAVNGVINIITRSAADTQGFYATAAAGPELTALAALRFGGQLAEGVHFRAYGKHVDYDDTVRADGTPARDAWHRSQGGFRIDAPDTASGAFTLQGDFYDNQSRDIEVVGEPSILRGANLLGRWTRSFSAESELSLQSYYDWFHMSDPTAVLVLRGVPVAPAGRLRDDLHTLDVDLQHRFRPSPAHGITWGAGMRYTHEVTAGAPSLTLVPENLDQWLFSLFGQDEIRLRDNVAFTIGTKVEHNDYTGFEFEPSARLQWQPVATQTLWAAVSRAVRTPSRLERDGAQAAPPYPQILIGDPEFKSEKVASLELGYRAGFGSRLGTSVALFYNDYDDIRSTSPTPVTLLPLRIVNDLEGRTWGLEAAGTLQLTDEWTVSAGYNLLKERLHVEPGRIDYSAALNETADPQQQFSLRSALTLPRRVELDAALRWVDTLHNNSGPIAGTVPDYMELEARLAWHPTERLELALVGRNLLHDHHPEYGFPNPRRLEVERSVYGRLTWRQ